MKWIKQTKVAEIPFWFAFIVTSIVVKLIEKSVGDELGTKYLISCLTQSQLERMNNTIL